MVHPHAHQSENQEAIAIDKILYANGRYMTHAELKKALGVRCVSYPLNLLHCRGAVEYKIDPVNGHRYWRSARRLQDAMFDWFKAMQSC